MSQLLAWIDHPWFFIPMILAVGVLYCLGVKAWRQRGRS